MGRIDVSDERASHYNYNFGRKSSNGIAVSYGILLKLQSTASAYIIESDFRDHSEKGRR